MQENMSGDRKIKEKKASGVRNYNVKGVTGKYYLTFWLEVSNITCVMMNDQENTIEKIKQTALDEFFMHGYNKASLRTICSRAGVTTGAMYFYFKNKEALFREIFEPLVVQYEELLVRYMKLELAEPELGTQLDVQMMQFILEHRKEAVIILEKAQGSC